MGVEIAYMQDKSDKIRDMLGYLQNNIVFAVVARILEIMNDRGGFADVEDDRPLPGSEWRLELYRERAALQRRCGRSGQRRTDGYRGD